MFTQLRHIDTVQESSLTYLLFLVSFFNPRNGIVFDNMTIN
ncbi:hypothetical protein MATR_28180 [Marivirga tractuosa]|uniref:Uncharacterized protein n=1 Tax=Marivirga tractuosa (strain ATCC 23168 / DSM 4126 / NBRC 15989 / NCIMB 1408 / VKM B-1430 / H-43) TaxID=643867 RepID=E4TLQ4_MARTH|nr:hypothetical protein Ftrac_3359 [Marivirga tractuosa DSM 4126]BDD15993.1 hypothetical protein MATR_28180 [Marivirga tractuosa]